VTSDLLGNIASAASIAAVIVTMSVLRNPALKALVYSLPLPLSIALVATGGHVDGSSVMGLALLVSFLWLVRLLYGRTGSIAGSDLLAAVSYLGLSWLLTRLFRPGFADAATLFGLGWLVFAFVHRPGPPHVAPQRRVDVRAKGAVVFGLSLLLLSARNLLAGAVVTFPFSGVFAVVEARENLAQLAAVFTRNSIAILALLIAVHATQRRLGLWPALLVGWSAYLVVMAALMLARRLGLYRPDVSATA
jgi:hypothetical protein